MTAETLHPRAASQLRPRTHKIILEDLAVNVDIGFHDFEIGNPQRLLISVWVSIDIARWPAADSREHSWDYDYLHKGIHALAVKRHYDLQETLAQEIFDMVASQPGVTALSIFVRKPDVYADAGAVGVWLSSE